MESSKLKIACVIPARLNSFRFPKKVLYPIQGKPMIQWVWEAAQAVPFFHSVTIAIDALETAAVVDTFGGKCFMTRQDCPNGTVRIGELVKAGKIEGDIIVNWQGDEPFIDELMIRELLQSIDADNSDIWTLKQKILEPDEVNSPHVVKVVTDLQETALYFSRASIPCPSSNSKYRDKPTHYKHIGLYAYRREAIEEIPSLAISPLALIEDLEQLSWLHHGLKIKVHTTDRHTRSVDFHSNLNELSLFLTKK